MSRTIDSVAVLGSGTMGMGIAAACAEAGCNVLLLDITEDAARGSLERATGGKRPMIEDAGAAARIATGSFDGDLGKIAGYDWVCEAIVEDLDTKRGLFEKIEAARSEGSVVTSNTSGIPLRAITEGMPQRLRRDIAITHFFNPVKVMRLMELVPGADTTDATLGALSSFCGSRLGKGVVLAKDTVNFIGNRIGCFWMLSGLHKAKDAQGDGLNIETVDALMSKPLGIPPTGLYGLIDLIGLDIMNLVGKNLEANLATDDIGRSYTRLPAAEQAMLDRGQLGRKTGGGFYRVTKQDDGSRIKDVFDLGTEDWRRAEEVALDEAHSELTSLLFADDVKGRFAWEMMSTTLGYTADLVPEISDDIVGVDRAMRWGFAWRSGPFQMLETLEPNRVADRMEREGKPVPHMLGVLRKAGADSFYRNDGKEFLGVDGDWHQVGPE